MPVAPPPLTLEIASRLDHANIRSQAEGAAAVAAQPGNPFEFEVRNWGSVIAWRTRTIPHVAWYNRAGGLDDTSIPLLPEILDWYHAVGAAASFEVSPASMTEAMADVFAASNLRFKEFKSILYGRAVAVDLAVPAGVEIRESPADELETWLQTWGEGFGLPDFALEYALPIRRSWFATKSYRRYVALVEGRVAGIAGLYTIDGVGHLEPAAVLPWARSRGIQSAFIRRRISDSAAAGCDLVTCETRFAVQSQHNLQRAGMQMAFTNGIWSSPPPVTASS